MTEQLFLAKEAKEKAEFGTYELAATLEAKTQELETVLDVLEDYKSWHSKLGNLETQIKQESREWKTQAEKLSEELKTKNGEVVEAVHGKKLAEEEALKAYKAIDIVQKQNLELKQKLENEEQPQEVFAEINSIKKQLEKLKTKNVEMQNEEYKYQEEISQLQEENSRLHKMNRKPPQKKPQVSKKSLQFEKPVSDNENRFAVEIVNLNKQLNKYKHEYRQQTDVLKKTLTELESLRKQQNSKTELLEKLRRENEHLSISLTTDHYKSIPQLERKNIHLEAKVKELSETLLETTAGIDRLKSQAIQQESVIDKLTQENEGLATSKAEENSAFIAKNLSSLQSQFARLKECSDKQIGVIENLKLENLQLMNEIENYKSLLRSSKLHASKAEADVDAYSQLLRQIEGQLAESEVKREQAEADSKELQERFMRIINS